MVLLLIVLIITACSSASSSGGCSTVSGGSGPGGARQRSVGARSCSFLVRALPGLLRASSGRLMGQRDINSFPPVAVAHARLHPENYTNALDVIPLGSQYLNSVAAARA